ncbi:MAG: 5' nucleotidase, NT5C type [Candidatus Micrarchaeia archaeon]
MQSIGIDLDDTIADTVKPFLDILRNRYGFEMRREDWTRYLFSENPGAIKVDVMELFKEVWNSPDSIPLLDSNIPRIISDIHNKFEIYIVTATLGEDKTVRMWLGEHSIEFDKIIYVRSPMQKGNIHNISIYIDDYYEAAVNMAKRGKEVIILKQPWNAKFSASDDEFKDRITFADSWDEIRTLLLKNSYKKGLHNY